MNHYHESWKACEQCFCESIRYHKTQYHKCIDIFSHLYRWLYKQEHGSETKLQTTTFYSPAPTRVYPPERHPSGGDAHCLAMIGLTAAQFTCCETVLLEAHVKNGFEFWLFSQKFDGFWLHLHCLNSELTFFTSPTQKVFPHVALILLRTAQPKQTAEYFTFSSPSFFTHLHNLLWIQFGLIQHWSGLSKEKDLVFDRPNTKNHPLTQNDWQHQVKTNYGTKVLGSQFLLIILTGSTFKIRSLRSGASSRGDKDSEVFLYFHPSFSSLLPLPICKVQTSLLSLHIDFSRLYKRKNELPMIPLKWTFQETTI